MAYSLLPANIKSVIKISIFLLVQLIGQSIQNFAGAQTVPGNSERAGLGENLPGVGQPGGIPREPGFGQESPLFPQSAADQRPALATGSQQVGQMTTGTKNDLASLKSVRDQSHPIYDFLDKVTRPVQSDTEKEIYLCEILSGVTSPAQRRELLKAYWNLSEKRLHCHVRLVQLQRLQMVKGYMQTEQLPTDDIDLALLLVEQQYRALELEFVQAQYRFLDLQSKTPAALSSRWRTGYADDGNELFECDDVDLQIPSAFVVQKPEDRLLPVPVDFPLAVPYNTKVEELTKRRILSQKSLLLNRTIPLQYETIVARTAARSYANNQWQTVLTKYRQSPVTLIEALAQEEMALINTIIEYNHQVDEYVIETFGANIPEKQLLASILVLPKPSTAETGQNRMPTIYSNNQPDGNSGQ